VPVDNPWWVAIGSGLIAAVLFLVYRRLIGRWMGQRFREDGPIHHKRKGFVPTGAGIVIAALLGISGILAAVYFATSSVSSEVGIYVCIAALLMGVLGYVDDWMKVKFGSEGLKARFKILVMIIVGLLFLYALSFYFHEIRLLAEQTGNPQPWPVYAPWWVYYPVGLFVWLGSLNGANFTDGLDGLLSSTTVVVLTGAFFALLDGSEPLALPASVGMGCLLAFLIFNWRPALMYMGDSGSLTVGALVAGLFLAKGWWLFLGLCVFIWVANVLSVILQVLSYRLFRRRILLCSPLHHHFEFAGWGERQIVFSFTAVQAFGCVVAFAWLRYGTVLGLVGALLLVALTIMLVWLNRKPAEEFEHKG
jgi:phospho-N-acetylmuramoyl-pentapeptide-transferase